jgi:hypothetical protein
MRSATDGESGKVERLFAERSPGKILHNKRHVRVDTAEAKQIPVGGGNRFLVDGGGGNGEGSNGGRRRAVSMKQ